MLFLFIMLIIYNSLCDTTFCVCFYYFIIVDIILIIIQMIIYTIHIIMIVIYMIITYIIDNLIWEYYLCRLCFNRFRLFYDILFTCEYLIMFIYFIYFTI